MIKIFKMRKLLITILLVCFCGCEDNSEKISAAVVSARIEASSIGVDIMKKGGNAFDAMVATDLALSVCYPNAGNIGGGGFLVYRTETGEVGSLDFREKAPSKAYEKMFINPEGYIAKNKSTTGGLSVGVPGTIAGLFEVHGKLCSMPFEDLIQPAIDLARNGFIVTEKQAKRLNKYQEDFISLNGQETFYGRRFSNGDTIININMAKTLEKIKLIGKDGFYKGMVADKIIETRADSLWWPLLLPSWSLFQELLAHSYQPRLDKPCIAIQHLVDPLWARVLLIDGCTFTCPVVS